MLAREPDAEGYVDRGGVKLDYGVFGDGAPTLLLLPTWTIIHARFWKAQVPYLARHYRVVTYDGPGNGRSDRPLDAGPYGHGEQARAAAAVLDATATGAAVQDFLEFFFAQCFPEPHSTKPIQDSVGWGLETSPEVLIAENAAPGSTRRPCAAGAPPAAARCWWSTGPRTASARCGGAGRWPRPPAATWSSWRAPATSRWPATRSR